MFYNQIKQYKFFFKRKFKKPLSYLNGKHNSQNPWNNKHNFHCQMCDPPLKLVRCSMIGTCRSLNENAPCQNTWCLVDGNVWEGLGVLPCWRCYSQLAFSPSPLFHLACGLRYDLSATILALCLAVLLPYSMVGLSWALILWYHEPQIK